MPAVLERLESTYEEERWLVQDGDALPHVVWFIQHDDLQHLIAVERATRAWLGPVHPRVATIRAIARDERRLRLEVDDDRGPTFAAAAAQLADPIERERWAVAQTIAIADGLATLRQRDNAFVHRQLEPHRMFVDVAGRVRLRAPVAFVLQGPRPMRTGAGVVRGTPAFMSPEQAKGMPVTAASDVFALASNLYFALSGRRPFDRDGQMMQELLAIMQEQPQPLATHAPNLKAVLDRAFAKTERERYPDPGTFAGELWQCVPDAVDYDEVVSDRIVTWRATAPDAKREDGFATPPCKKRWEELAPTTNAEVRHCGECSQEVTRATSMAQVVPLLGRCVAYTGGD